MHIESTALLRLMHLISPTLPIGAFTYSQGLEWAVEAAWVSNEQQLEDWLEGQLCHGLCTTDIPILVRLWQAVADQQPAEFDRWSRRLLAYRDTQELRTEERQRGKALVTLLPNLGIDCQGEWAEPAARCQAAGFALAAAQWQIPANAAALGYAWAWLENQVIAAVKIIPLGQTAGQRLLHRLSPQLPAHITPALHLKEHQLGGSLPALAIASSHHEQQYTRLFRS